MFHKYTQELTSKNYLLKHRLRLFDAAITPTICYASGTWAPTKEYERMLQSTQCYMLRLIIQTRRRCKKIVKHKVKNSEDINDPDSRCTNNESEDGKVTHLIMTKTVTCHSRVTMTKRLMLQRLKKRNGLATLKGAPTKLWKRENEKIRCWKMTPRKKEMETGDENRNITEREMVDQSC